MRIRRSDPFHRGQLFTNQQFVIGPHGISLFIVARCAPPIEHRFGRYTSRVANRLFTELFQENAEKGDVHGFSAGNVDFDLSIYNPHQAAKRSPAAAEIFPSGLTTQGSGVRGPRASLSSVKSWTAPHPLQPIVRPRAPRPPWGVATDRIATSKLLRANP